MSFLPSRHGQRLPLKSKSSLPSDVEPFKGRFKQKQTTPIISRPVITRPVKDKPVPKVTISTAAILKRKPMKEVYGKKHHRRHRHVEQDHPLFLDYKEDTDTYLSAILEQANIALANTHTELLDNLSVIQRRDEDALNTVTAQRDILLIPLTEEKIMTTYKYADGRTKQVELRVGDQVDEFRQLIEKESAKLELLWAEWDIIDEKLLELGVEVLGAGAFDPDTPQIIEKGYEKEMERWNAEMSKELDDFDDELEDISQEAIRMMQAAEKEIANDLKREQAKIFKMMFAEDD